jgi:hypothetical protein
LKFSGKNNGHIVAVLDLYNGKIFGKGGAVEMPGINVSTLTRVLKSRELINQNTGKGLLVKCNKFAQILHLKGENQRKYPAVSITTGLWASNSVLIKNN